MPSSKPGRSSPAGFTDEERAAMRERARETTARGLKAAAATIGNDAVLAKIATLSPADRELAAQVHALVMRTVPHVEPRLWYGMPAYAIARKVVCFLQPAEKFKTRYATLGFSDKAALDDGAMWPVAFALERLTADVERRITALIRKAVG